MAKVFISYSHKDKDLVQLYVTALRKYNHEILMDETVIQAGKNLQDSLMEAMRNADGTIVFLTENSVQSFEVTSEIGLARSNFDNIHKFLIPLVKGSAPLPYLIQDIEHFQIEQRDPNEIAGKITQKILDYLKSIDKQISGDKSHDQSNGNSYTNLGPAQFAKSLYTFLGNIPKGSNIGNWAFRGNTQIAYPTPIGPWDKPGFLFESSVYSFILRSVWDGGQNQDASYLVIESNNLRGQLANIALYNTDKFKNVDGQVSILETYDMTVGSSGRRAREEVREAFANVGSPNNIITTFDEKNIDWLLIISDILQWAIYREKAKLLLQRPVDPTISQSGSTFPNFWFLKIYGDNWNLPGIEEGDEGHFNSHFNSYEKRPDYEYFKAVKPGDRGIAYDYSSKKEIVFLFEVTQPLHYDEDREEIFSFTITMILKTGIQLSIFEENVPFASGLDRESVKKLFPLTKSEYDILFGIISSESLVDFEINILSRPALSAVFADSATKDIKDQLGFENDINALASVIAYREVKPPLAIGLFGNWGTGKSFFMNKLQQKIEELSGDSNGIFCKKVLQINFNSWHYSDSNLWASLITKIFEDLEDYGKNKPNELKELFKNLHSTKELLQITKNEKAQIDNEIDVLKNQKDILDADVKKKSEAINNLSVNEILTGLMKDISLQDDFDTLKKEYSFLNLKEYDDIEANVRKLDDFSKKNIQSAKLIFSSMKGKNLFLALLFVALITLGFFALNQNSGLLKKYFGDYKALICMITGAVALVVKFLQPAIKVMNQVFKRLKSLDHTIKELKKDARKKFAAYKEELDRKLTEAQSESNEIRKKIQLLEVQQTKLENDIDDISSGRKIIHFIESRVMDERYINSLGIISWVRKDFEQLDFLLRQQQEAQKALENGISGTPSVFELERIILYIDDLDRCSENIVVRVLEAIHLLLAFPLFVVVVGVDPRWMHNARM